MSSVRFAVTGDRTAWCGATDSGLSLESRGLLWGMLAQEGGMIEPSEYAQAIAQLIAAGYLVRQGAADALVMASPFSVTQAQVVFAKNHPMSCTQGKKQTPLGERFFGTFQERYNELKSPSWARCESQTPSRVKSLSAYLRECKRRSEGEFLVYGLDVFERCLQYAAQDQWWRTHRHSIGVFLKIKSDHPFDLAEKFVPGQPSLAASVASSWAMTGKGSAGGLLLC